MVRSKVKCELCFQEISKSNIKRHINSEKCKDRQELTDFEKKSIKEKDKIKKSCVFNKDTNKYKCPFCEKEYKGISYHIWRVHGKGKNFKPAKGSISWNKGLTKKTDNRVKQYGETYSAKIKSGEIIPSFLGKKHKKETIEKMKANPNCGGAGRGGGYGKFGRYKGYWCDSSWEIAFVLYNLDHNIKFKRNKEKFLYIFEGKEKFFYPDFIVDEKYIEIKGYETEQWKAKMKYFKKPLIVLYKNEMKIYIDYCIKKYGKDFIKLYE